MSGVLVTGVTGFVAGQVVDGLLAKGHTVHGTVRDKTDTAKLQGLFDAVERHKAEGGCLTLFDADLLEEGAFDEAMAGCSHVIHCASPFTMKLDNVEENLLKPAVEGTRNILTSVSKTEGKVCKVVLTSSFVAICADSSDTTGGQMPTESMWNTTGSAKHSPYSYSKTLAEQEAWKLHGAQETKHWDLAVINPVFVMGPTIHPHLRGTSFEFFNKVISGDFKRGIDVSFGFVDVRDVADAHIKAMAPNQSGRHLTANKAASILEVGQVLRALPEFEKYKKALPLSTLPKPLAYIIGPMLGMTWKWVSRNVGHQCLFDNTKSRETLGVEYRPLEDTFRDMLHSVEKIQAAAAA